jgi:large conductance mechanosensitive channel
MKNFFSDFKKFAMRGNVVDLAVGVIIGAAFGAITTSLVKDLITPLISLFIGGLDLTAVHAGPFMFGNFIQALINFIIIAFVVFLMVKGINAMRRKEEEKPPAPAQSNEEKILIEIRDLLKERR